MTDVTDCIVIGGGVIGLSVARRLALEGCAVTLIERGVCGGEASWAGAGVLSPCNPHRRDAVADLRRASLELYPAFCSQLHKETGIDPEFDACGELEIALNDAALRSLRSDEQAGDDQPLSDGRKAYEFLSAERTREVESVVSPAILGALLCNGTSQVRNPRLLRALRVSCERLGVRICEQTAVRDFKMDGSRVTGVRTDDRDWSASSVVLCAGAWSSSIGNRLHELMPVTPVRGQMILLKFDQRPFSHVVSRGKTYLVPRRDGHVLLGATEEPDAGFAKRNTPAGINRLFETGVKLVPMIADAPVVAQWAGLRPGTPDDNPYIGPVPGFENLFAATGHFRSGLILTPITAEVVIRMVSGRSIAADLSSCEVGRASRTR